MNDLSSAMGKLTATRRDTRRATPLKKVKRLAETTWRKSGSEQLCSPILPTIHHIWPVHRKRSSLDLMRHLGKTFKS
jgi:hypothetical protein